MDRIDLQMLRDLPIEEVAGRLGLQVTHHKALCPDHDAPGERLFLQLQSVLPNLQHHHLPPGCKDYSEYYLSIQP